MSPIYLAAFAWQSSICRRGLGLLVLPIGRRRLAAGPGCHGDRCIQLRVAESQLEAAGGGSRCLRQRSAADGRLESGVGCDKCCSISTDPSIKSRTIGGDARRERRPGDSVARFTRRSVPASTASSSATAAAAAAADAPVSSHGRRQSSATTGKAPISLHVLFYSTSAPPVLGTGYRLQPGCCNRVLGHPVSTCKGRKRTQLPNRPFHNAVLCTTCVKTVQQHFF